MARGSITNVAVISPSSAQSRLFDTTGSSRPLASALRMIRVINAEQHIILYIVMFGLGLRDVAILSIYFVKIEMGERGRGGLHPVWDRP